MNQYVVVSKDVLQSRESVVVCITLILGFFFISRLKFFVVGFVAFGDTFLEVSMSDMVGLS